MEAPIQDDAIRAPVAAWFDCADWQVKEALLEAQVGGQLREGVDPGDLALTLTALPQGGYLLARAHRGPAAMHRARRVDGAPGVVQLLTTTT